MPIISTPHDKEPGRTPRCRSCGGALSECCASSVVWHGSRPYVVEAIPALRCDACAETFIETATAQRLGRICNAADKIAPDDMKIDVPVFQFPETGAPPMLA